MRFASATASSPRAPRHGAARRLPGPWLAAAILGGALTVGALLGLPGCSSSSGPSTGKETGPGKTILATRQGESSIQVTESEIDGNQVIRINTRYRGEDNSIVLNIDQPVYEVEIPLTLEQIAPQSVAAAKSPEGQFQDLLIAQYMEKAQEAMLNGDYQGALRQVNLVLLTRPDHPQAHTMKGSIYYAMGNYSLANDEWERVLQLDPSNQEVRQFMDFLKSRKGAPQPPLPGAPRTPAAGAAGSQKSQGPAAPNTPAKPYGARHDSHPEQRQPSARGPEVGPGAGRAGHAGRRRNAGARPVQQSGEPDQQRAHDRVRGQADPADQH